MRNLGNSIKKISEFKGPLSYSIILMTARTTINQYERGWLKNSNAFTRLLDRDQILELLEKPLIGRKLDRELTQRGLDFLNNFLFTSKGAHRKTKALKHISLGFFDAVKNFSHFTFGGFETMENSCPPIWYVHAKNGEVWAYIYTGGPYSSDSGTIFRVNRMSPKLFQKEEK